MIQVARRGDVHTVVSTFVIVKPFNNFFFVLTSELANRTVNSTDVRMSLIL